MSCLHTDSRCIRCLLKRFANTDLIDISEERKVEYLKELLKIISDAPNDVSSPEIVEDITFLQGRYGIDAFDYSEAKKFYNGLLMSYEDEIWQKIKSAKDGLYTAMRYAFIGNYIDFGAISDVNEEKLKSFIDGVDTVEFDELEYHNFKNDLKNAKRLVYLTDNCGEIVFDKLFIRYLLENFKELQIQVVVRGKKVLNDATMDDIRQIGLDKIVDVCENGTGIAGTVLKKVNHKTRRLLDEADLIVSKGMGNFETINGCGKNIYYMFMCKCEKFCEHFQKPMFSYMFLNDLRLEVEND